MSANKKKSLNYMEEDPTVDDSISSSEDDDCDEPHPDAYTGNEVCVEEKDTKKKLYKSTLSRFRRWKSISKDVPPLILTAMEFPNCCSACSYVRQ